MSHPPGEGAVAAAGAGGEGGGESPAARYHPAPLQTPAAPAYKRRRGDGRDGTGRDERGLRRADPYRCGREG